MNNKHCDITVKPSTDRKEYDRQYRMINKAKIKEYEQSTIRLNANATRIRNKKFKLIQYKGGKCCNCNIIATNENSCIFDFHHTDDKLFSLAPYTKPMNELIKESDKCILLCSNCHRLIHKKDI